MNIAVYVRVSTQRQAQAQTIEQQLDSLQKYHEAQGWPWQEDHIFRDDGYSGAKLRRPGLDRLRELVGRAGFELAPFSWIFRIWILLANLNKPLRQLSERCAWEQVAVLRTKREPAPS